MSRLRTLGRHYGVDVLIVIAAVESALEVLLRQDDRKAPSTTPWLAAAILAAVILVLLGLDLYLVSREWYSFTEGLGRIFTPQAFLYYAIAVTFSKVILPASILARSSTSLMMARRWRPL